MRKLCSLGLVLLLVIYGLPLAYTRIYQGVDRTISQDTVQVNAETDIPAPAPEEDANPPAEMNTTPDAVTSSAPIDAVDGVQTITVLNDGTVTTMPLESYVAGVVAAEISPTFPADALRAQAVAARTYAIHKQRSGPPPEQHKGAEVCTDYHHCTAYLEMTTQASATWGKQADTYTDVVEKAVQATAGEILTVNDIPIVAVFSCASGPKTEAAVDVWGSEITYLQSVTSPGGEACPKYNSEVTVSATEFRSKVKQTFPTADVTGAPNTWFTSSVRSQGGGVKTVMLGGVRVEGTAVRTLFELNSTNFTLTTTADSITFHAVGYGHGVGMSQYGAKYMAEHGSGYQEILAHYFPGTVLAASAKK